jgi:twitching motility protein PilJ
MFGFNLARWFEDLTTKWKLLTAFGMVSMIIIVMSALGVWTTERLRQQADAIYVDYTIPLIDFNSLLLNLGKYNTGLQDLAKETRPSDFKDAVGKIGVYRQEVDKLIVAYEGTLLRVSSTGRDEAKDLVELKAALENFFGQAEAGISAIAESFESKSLSASQAQQMHDLGQQALTVGIAPAYAQIIYRHGEQIKDLAAVANDLNEEAKQLAKQGMLTLIVGGTVAVLLGLSIGYWVARKMALGLSQVAHVAQLAANGNYQARAKLKSKDELGQMAASFNAMLDRITALVTSESERDDMQKRLMGFLVLVSDVGKGDLTKRGEVTADMFGNLADGFNLMVTRFGQLLKQVCRDSPRQRRTDGRYRKTTGG